MSTLNATFTTAPASEAHAQVISDIATRTFALACPADTPAEELQAYIRDHLQAEHFKALLAAPGKQLLLLQCGDETAGYSLVDHQPEALGIAAADGMAELTRCYVLPQWHGSGAAQYLFNASLAQVAGPVRLTVNDQNLRALGFYRRNGFEQVGECHFQCGQDIHRDLVLVRQSGFIGSSRKAEATNS